MTCFTFLVLLENCGDKDLHALKICEEAPTVSYFNYFPLSITTKSREAVVIDFVCLGILGKCFFFFFLRKDLSHLKMCTLVTIFLFKKHICLCVELLMTILSWLKVVFPVDIAFSSKGYFFFLRQ